MSRRPRGAPRPFAVSERAALRRDLLAWYLREHRDLPWRRVRDPYAIWVSETMLQQTRTQTAIPYYERFMQRLPTVNALAEAPEEDVLALWSGLGYYRRARMLHQAAKRVASTYGGLIPQEADELRRLEGIGRYTAGAIASIAFGRRAALVDGNVARVLARVFAVEDDVRSSRGSATLWRLAEELVAGTDAGGSPGDWNQALMELGATVCVPRDPACGGCPVRAHCKALACGMVARLPRTQPRAQPLAVRRTVVVLASRRHVLLARRRGGAAFGGLWEPPGTPDRPAMPDTPDTAERDVAALASRLGVAVGALQHTGEVVHLLTHRRMHVDVARGALPRRKVWPIPSVDYDAIERVPWDDVAARPQSTLARKVLIMANVTARGLRWKK
jgi:A/G-specific adenine glycosylase